MNKTRIPWADYTINPVKGLCPMACKDTEGKEYCYARKMYRRFRWNPEIHFDKESLLALEKIKKPSRIFIGSTMELFGEWVDREWLNAIFYMCRKSPQHIFIFLTKQPYNLKEWSPFPSNCWIGATVTSNGSMTLALTNLAGLRASVRFLSIEPLLGQVGMRDHMSMRSVIDWIILGSRTQPVRYPRREWVEELIWAADKAGIPVFVKSPTAEHFGINRKEFPEMDRP